MPPNCHHRTASHEGNRTEMRALPQRGEATPSLPHGAGCGVRKEPGMSPREPKKNRRREVVPHYQAKHAADPTPARANVSSSDTALPPRHRSASRGRRETNWSALNLLVHLMKLVVDTKEPLEGLVSMILDALGS